MPASVPGASVAAAVAAGAGVDDPDPGAPDAIPNAPIIEPVAAAVAAHFAHRLWFQFVMCFFPPR